MRPGIWQIAIVVLLIVVLFGAKKLPELARSLGKAKGEFKKGLREGDAEESASAEALPSPEAEKTKA